MYIIQGSGLYSFKCCLIYLYRTNFKSIKLSLRTDKHYLEYLLQLLSSGRLVLNDLITLSNVTERIVSIVAIESLAKYSIYLKQTEGHSYT